MGDTQLTHIGGLLKAALNAATAGSVDTVYALKLPMSAPWARHPCLELYREREEFTRRGNTSQRLRNVTVRINYYVGPVDGSKLDAWAGTLQTRVQLIDDTIETGYHASYSGGSDLDTLAGIEQLEVQSVEYDNAESGGAIEGAYPALSFVVQMTHRYTRYTEGATVLAGVDVDQIFADSTEPFHLTEGESDTSTQDGTNGQIVATGTLFNAATAAFTTAHVGWFINVSDATNPTNDGDHEITARNSGTQVVLGGAVGLVNEAALNWTLHESEVPE